MVDNPDNRMKVGKALKGRVFSEESKKRMSDSAKNRIRKNKKE
jgi:hypothetical protein